MSGDAARPAHGMLPGSHERRGGPECRCGGVWFYWDGMCLEQLKEGESIA